ncbi:MAG: response regulator transcription factor [Clostridia bacterium]|nr:response regulator transcription factor [Clostridia bacterium]
MIRVLLVEDDRDIARVVRFYLSSVGDYVVRCVGSAEDALQAIDEGFDIILLDIMLPEMDGITLCQQIRERIYCPILFISCLDDEDTIVRALEIGGDDYLTKPFTCKVLDARIKANLRRMKRETAPSHAYIFPDFSLDIPSHSIIRKERAIPLAPLEFGILQYLIEHPNQTVTSDQIYEAVWGQPSYGDARTVIVHLYNIRKKIDAPGRWYIKNVRGSGYCFDPQGIAAEDTDA